MMETQIEHYRRAIEEIILNSDSLRKSRPLSRITSNHMRMEKDETLQLIDYVIGFLEGLRSEVEGINVIEER